MSIDRTYHRRLMLKCGTCEELAALLDQATATYWSALHRQERLSLDGSGASVCGKLAAPS